MFFFEIPPFEDPLHSKCATRREELGRPTPRVPRVFSVEILLGKKTAYSMEDNTCKIIKHSSMRTSNLLENTTRVPEVPWVGPVGSRRSLVDSRIF